MQGGRHVGSETCMDGEVQGGRHAQRERCMERDM